jgi:hypothetical protein
MTLSYDRWKERSRTFPGLARAAAAQWAGIASQEMPDD